MRFLVTGCGSIGRRHIRNLKSLEDCEILAHRVRGEDLGDFGREYGVQAFSSLSDALDRRPDAVFVTNPTSLHVPTALEAARRGIDLFIEKPVSDTLEGVDELLRVCEERKLVAMVAYKMRFHKSLRFLKSLLDGGGLGRPLYGRAHYGGYLPDWHPWEDYRRMYSARRELGGGIVLDATHEIDTLYWLLGEVAEVKAFCGKIGGLDMNTEDSAQIGLRFASNAYGSAFVTYLQRPESRACEIVGTEGTAVWNQSRACVEVYRAANGSWETFPEGETYDPNQMFVDEVKHFLECARSRRQPSPGLREGRRVLEIALAVKAQMQPESQWTSANNSR